MIVIKRICVFFATLILLTHVSAATAPTIEREVVPLTIPQMIVKYAKENNVSADVLTNVIRCESNFNPKAINNSPIEYSVGLSQINLRAHTNITVEQAMDPDFAIRFMAERIDKSPHMWSCYSKIYG